MLAEQIRGARAILRMEQSELAELAGVSVPTIRRLEAMDGEIEGVRSGTLEAIKRAFETRGVVLGSDAWGPNLSIRLNSPLLSKIFDEISQIFPDYNMWTWHNDSFDGYDFEGAMAGSNDTLYVAVRTNLSEAETAFDDLRRATRNNPRAHRALIALNAPYDGKTPDGIQVLSYPREYVRDDEDMDLVD